MTSKPTYDYQGAGPAKTTSGERNLRWHALHMTRTYPCITDRCQEDWEGFARYGLKGWDPMAAIDPERSRRNGLHMRWCVGAGKPCKTSRCDPDMKDYGENGLVE